MANPTPLADVSARSAHAHRHDHGHGHAGHHGNAPHHHHPGLVTPNASSARVPRLSILAASAFGRLGLVLPVIALLWFATFLVIGHG